MDAVSSNDNEDPRRKQGIVASTRIFHTLTKSDLKAMGDHNVTNATRPNDVLAANLIYTVDDGVTPWLYTRPMISSDPHSAGMGGTMVPVAVQVTNGRDGDFSLDRNAFQLVPQETPLTNEDFYLNTNKVIETVYYKEMEDLLRRHLGAAKVVVYMHVVRNEAKTGEEGPGASVRGYSHGVHVDYAPSWAEQTFAEALGDIRQCALLRGDDDDRWMRYATGRFVVINAWRNISPHPIEQNPLAVCDEASLVKPDDYLPGDFYRDAPDHPVTKTYRLVSRNARQHQWYYFPRMNKDEVVLMKQFDSDTTLSGRMCFHTAFADPTAAANAPPRESIEVRAVAFFPDHAPNTCPPYLPTETRTADTGAYEGE
jgi:hypothetical protein